MTLYRSENGKIHRAGNLWPSRTACGHYALEDTTEMSGTLVGIRNHCLSCFRIGSR